MNPISFGNRNVVLNLLILVSSDCCSYGHPQVNTFGDIVFVSFSELPYKLGRVYCANRPMALMHTNVNDVQVLKQITSNDFSARSPRFVPDSRSVIYFQRLPYGPHSDCEAVMLYDLEHQNSRELVPVVKSYPTNDGVFAGIYCDQLISNPFITVNGKHTLLVSTIHKNTVATLGIGLTQTHFQSRCRLIRAAFKPSSLPQ